MRGKKADLNGMKFGKLQILSKIEHKNSWKCLCDCGIQLIVKTRCLTRNSPKQNCGKCVRNHNFIDISNNIYGKLTVIKYFGTWRRKSYWECKCECGNLIKATATNLKRGKTQSCGCSRRICGPENKGWLGFGQISGDYWCSIKNGALTRKLEFNINKEYAWKIFEEQNRKCNLTGMEINITFDRIGQTASLDRIDNKKGYIENNIQWLHKDINRMKWAHSQEYFIELCKKVVEGNKNNGTN